MKATAHASLSIADGPQGLLAHLDEDAVTLCVEAGRLALAAANLAPEQLAAIQFPAALPGASQEHVRLGLGAKAAQIVDAASQDVAGPAIRLDLGPTDPLQRPRLATATIVGAGSSTPASAQQQLRTPKRVAQDFAQRIPAAEARSLAQVPMGAYISRTTWDASLEARYRLLVSTCHTCRGSSHPPFLVCPRCKNPTTIESHLRGTIHTFTTIAKGAGPTEFDEWQALDGDYVVAIVDLPPGVRVAGMMTSVDAARVRIGQPVRGVLRRLYGQEGTWRYGTKFELANEQPNG